MCVSFLLKLMLRPSTSLEGNKNKAVVRENMVRGFSTNVGEVSTEVSEPFVTSQSADIQNCVN